MLVSARGGSHRCRQLGRWWSVGWRQRTGVRRIGGPDGCGVRVRPAGARQPSSGAGGLGGRGTEARVGAGCLLPLPVRVPPVSCDRLRLRPDTGGGFLAWCAPRSSRTSVVVKRHQLLRTRRRRRGGGSSAEEGEAGRAGRARLRPGGPRERAPGPTGAPGFGGHPEGASPSPGARRSRSSRARNR